MSQRRRLLPSTGSTMSSVTMYGPDLSGRRATSTILPTSAGSHTLPSYRICATKMVGERSRRGTGENRGLKRRKCQAAACEGAVAWPQPPNPLVCGLDKEFRQDGDWSG